MSSGDSIYNRHKQDKHSMTLKIGYSGIQEMPRISVRQGMILDGDIKDEVYMFRFNNTYVSPVDDKIYIM